MCIGKINCNGSCNSCHNDCQPTNMSNRTIVTGQVGESWIDEYRAFYPEDTRTDKEIIDWIKRDPSPAVPDSTLPAPVGYDQDWADSLLNELRQLKRSLESGEYLTPNV